MQLCSKIYFMTLHVFDSLEQWSKPRHKGWMDALRIAFGLLLHLKGLFFIYYTFYIMNMQQLQVTRESVVVIVKALAFLHFFLGTFIVIGVGTRLACLVLIPTIIVSIFFSNPGFSNEFQLLYSIAMLMLSIFYFFQGDGRFSMRQYMNNSAISSRVKGKVADWEAKNPS